MWMCDDGNDDCNDNDYYIVVILIIIEIKKHDKYLIILSHKGTNLPFYCMRSCLFSNYRVLLFIWGLGFYQLVNDD